MKFTNEKLILCLILGGAILFLISCSKEQAQTNNLPVVEKLSEQLLKLNNCQFVNFKSSRGNTVLRGICYRNSDTIMYIPITKLHQLEYSDPYSHFLSYPILPVKSAGNDTATLYGKTAGNKILPRDKYHCKLLDVSICETEECIYDTVYFFENFIGVAEYSKLQECVQFIDAKYSDAKFGIFKAMFIYSSLRGLLYFDYLQGRTPALPYLPYVKNVVHATTYTLKSL